MSSRELALVCLFSASCYYDRNSCRLNICFTCPRHHTGSQASTKLFSQTQQFSELKCNPLYFKIIRQVMIAICWAISTCYDCVKCLISFLILVISITTWWGSYHYFSPFQIRSEIVSGSTLTAPVHTSVNSKSGGSGSCCLTQGLKAPLCS